MALKLWLGNAGSGKSHDLFTYVVDEALKHKDRNYLVIVPEQFTLQTQKDLVNLHPSGGIMNIDVLNFTRLSYRVFEEVGFAKAPGLIIDDMGKNLILRHLATEHEDELTVIGKNLKKLGYISEVKSIISEFMQYGVNEDALELLIRESDKNNRRLLTDKLSDIKTVYSSFNSYIRDKYTTSEELLTRVCNILPESEKLNHDIIIFDGFTGFTPVQYNLIAALLKKCVDVHVTVLLDTISPMDIPYDEQELFYLSRKTIKELKHIAEENHVKVESDHVIKEMIPYRYKISNISNDMLVHLEKNLFRDECECFTKESDNITIMSARNPLDEMRLVAIKIMELIREMGYHYKDIAVVTGDMDTYLHAAERIFTLYDIPHFVDKTQPLLLNPFVEYLRSILQVLTENYSFEGIFGYLKSSLTDYSREEVDRLENYCRACGIKGKKNWHNRFIRCPKGFDQDELQSFEEIRTRVIEPFMLFDGAKNVKDFCVALYHVLVKENIQEKLMKSADYFSDKGDLLRAKEYGQIYREIIELINKLAELLGDEEMDIREFSELIDAGIDEIRIGIIPNFTDYIQIGDLTRSRFRDIKVLFFVGLNDGVVPAENSGGGILTDFDREFFKDMGVNVELAPSARMKAYTQRLYLYMIMTKPSERLLLSYARIAEDGSPMAPSYLIDEIQNMYSHIPVISYEDMGTIDRIYNKKEGFMELSGLLGKSGIESSALDEAALFELYAEDPEYRERLKKVLQGAFSYGCLVRRDPISKAVASAIYGTDIRGSVTRLETYALCAYRHFLKYGLKLQDRLEFSFESRDLGSVFHEVLEEYAMMLEKKGLSWMNISQEESDFILEESIKRVVVRYDAIYATFRSTYMIERIRRILKRTIYTLGEQIKHGEFIPKRFELDFSGERNLKSIHFKLSEEEKMHLVGRVDRVDLLELEDTIYVKVIDYKSGANNLNLAAVYKGEQLQLVVYMNAVLEMLSAEHPNKAVKPAGILYYHLDDPLVEADYSESDEVIENKIMKALKLQGLVNSDDEIYMKMDDNLAVGTESDIIPLKINKTGEFSKDSNVANDEEFGVISDYVNFKILEMGRTMVSGNIEASGEGCKYCDYKNICHMNVSSQESDDSNEEDEEANVSEMSKDEIIAKMKEKLG